MLKRKYRWICDNVFAPSSLVEGLANIRGINLITSQDMLSDPFDIMNMYKAVERIKHAIEKNEKIAIYGDYDVDGITATAIVYLTLKGLSANVIYYIPDRLDEGYGLNKDAINYLSEQGVTLIITVDCGISAIEEIEYAKEKNIDVIITDHHKCGSELPKAYCIINPKQNGDVSKFKDLSGAGIAFKMGLAMGNEVDDFVDIAALGTITDIVPLVGENRTIARLGLNKMQNRERIGLKALMDVCGLHGDIKAEDIGYIIGPRLNAAGRMSTPELALKLILSNDVEVATNIAQALNKLNIQRQNIENEIYKKAVNMIDDTIDDVIVVASEGWHEGVIGIVASKITELYNRPSIVISLTGEIGKGSCRSIKHFNIYEALNYCKQFLIKYGGHDMAAGLTIERNNVEKFKNLINVYAKKFLKEEYKTPEIQVNSVISDEIKEVIDVSFAKKLTALEPYGMGNSRPVFLFKNLTVDDIRSVGNDKHIKLRLSSSNIKSIDAIGFNMCYLINRIKTSDIIDVVCNLDVNEWNGMQSLQLNIIDVAYSAKQLNKLYCDYLNSLENLLIKGFSKKEIGNNSNVSIIEKDRIKEILKNGKYLILIYSFRQLINFIKEYDDLLEDIDLCFGKIDSDNENIILVNPDLNEPYVIEQFKKYDYILIYSMLFNVDKNYNEAKPMILKVMDKSEFKLWREDFCDIIPKRKDYEDIYRYIKKNEKAVSIKDMISDLKFNPLKIKLCIRVFEDVGIIGYTKANEDSCYTIKNSNKVRLEDSSVYINLITASKLCGNT